MDILLKSLLKSFLLSPTLIKWNTLKEFIGVARERDVNFDDFFDLLLQFIQDHKCYPTLETMRMLSITNKDIALTAYSTDLQNNPDLQVSLEDSEFIVKVKFVEKALLDLDLNGVFQEHNTGLNSLEVQDKESSLKQVEDTISKLHKVKDRFLHSEASTSGLLFGAGVLLDHQNNYAEIEKQKRDDTSLYYTLGWRKLERVKIHTGDLVVLGGFTSHGKSILLRNICYRLITEYGLNCFFCTREMKYETVRDLFNILHANNKCLFPGAPDIRFESFQEGLLTPEEKRHLEFAVNDFATNDAYGNLFLEYPNKSKYRLSDLKTKMLEVENSSISFQVLAVDYLTLLYPIESDKGRPEREDYNQMIKEFKSLALSHKDRSGNPNPLIAITPAQISRGALSDCIKNNQYYDISALREYSELEASADHVLTTLLLPEMRNTSTLKIQQLKNRSGALDIEPQDFDIDLKNGFSITEKRVQNTQDYANRLIGLKI